MPVPKSRQAQGWSAPKRHAAAVEKILDEGWKVMDAAAYYGCDRKTLSKRLKEERISRGLAPTAREQRVLDNLRRERMEGQFYRAAEAEVGEDISTYADNARSVHTAELIPDDMFTSPLVDEKRRVPPPEEFNRMYFGHFMCPDCDTHHESPAFHSEIWAASQNEGIKRAVINMPPYHAKTTVLTVRDTIYDTVKNPNYRTILLSESKPFSMLILGAIKELLQSHEMYYGAEANLINDWGPFWEPGTTWNNEQIMVLGRNSSEKDPTIQALGYRGQIYGRRADKIKSDDIASFQNQANPEAVDTMLKWFDSQVLSRIGRFSRILWVGTRVRPGDIYEHLARREGYHVLKYPCILDEEAGLTLWPDHFPYEDAVVRRAEMDPVEWQLVYQNVNTVTHGLSFSPDKIDECHNPMYVPGEVQPGWFLIAGLDPAGAGKDSGYTAFVLLAVDPTTGQRFLVAAEAHKQMRAPQLKEKILEWSDRWPIYEWRVEANGVQRNLVQYNDDIIRPLAARGIRVSEHVTNQNKWDPTFGVETLAPLFNTNLITFPGTPGHSGSKGINTLVDQLKQFPLSPVTDLAMALWFAELGARQMVQRPSLPLFDSRTKRWPKRIRKQRHMVDFHTGNVEALPLNRQRSEFFNSADRRRLVTGRPTMYPDLREGPPQREAPFMNREGFVYVDED